MAEVGAVADDKLSAIQFARKGDYFEVWTPKKGKTTIHEVHCSYRNGRLVIYCTCPRWRFQNKGAGQERFCKHLLRLESAGELHKIGWKKED